jgi:hypothetical protein
MNACRRRNIRQNITEMKRKVEKERLKHLPQSANAMAVARFCDKNGKFDIEKLTSIVSSEKASSMSSDQPLHLTA